MNKTRKKKLDAYLYNFGEEYVKESKKKTVSAIDCMNTYNDLRKFFEDLNKRPLRLIEKRVL